jgi:transcriptional regulator with XRE-family HTH domain
MVKMTKNLKQIDKSIGSRIMNLRITSGYSRSVLADHLEVTHQQLQKYEKGINRISAGRLIQIADFFKVDLKSLYEDSKDQITSSEIDTSEQRQSLEFFKLFKKIEDADFKRSICSLVRSFLKINEN